MGQSCVHPSIFVEIESNGSDNGRNGRPSLKRIPFPFPRIQHNLRLGGRHDHVNRTIIIKIGADNTVARSFTRKTGSVGYIGECAVAVVAPERIFARNTAAHIEIKVTIVVIVDEGEASRRIGDADSEGFGGVLESAVALIMKDHDARGGGESDVSVAVIVVVPCGTSNAVECGIEASFTSDIFKLPVAKIA